MADGTAPNAAQLPPPPQPNQGAPGFENGQKPPPPLHIPQNTNPIPTAITSPMSGVDKVMSPGSAGGFGRRAAPEPNKRALYVGGLDQRVTEDILRQIFETTGHVQSVKIIPDKNVSRFRPVPRLPHVVNLALTAMNNPPMFRAPLPFSLHRLYISAVR